ncbi:MAG: sulfurtransferase [Gemmatimonadales bacterium]|jgi:thiosulfate/3-mercaptopyruvate sulfurtransferase
MKTMFAGLVVPLLIACAGPEIREDVQPLVDAAWLVENVEETVVLDIRSDDPSAGSIGMYALRHIPGAIHSPYGAHPWRVTRDGVPGMLPAVEDLTALIGGLGISSDDHVVIVAAGQSAGDLGASTRVYWAFKVLGHERVSILNGGFRAWANAGYPTEAGRNQPAPTSYTANYQPQLVAGMQDVAAALESGVPLIDARPERHYRGEGKFGAAARYGTIAGAKNVPYTMLTAGDGGMFADQATLRSLWTDAGLPIQGEQIAFCNIGHAGSLAWFAAYELLGNREAKLYDASLVEWAAYPDVPMDNTDNPNRR